jgi:hypothetical protein
MDREDTRAMPLPPERSLKLSACAVTTKQQIAGDRRVTAPMRPGALPAEPFPPPARISQFRSE